MYYVCAIANNIRNNTPQLLLSNQDNDTIQYMTYMRPPTKDDFLLLGHDTERWLDTVNERRGPVDGMGNKVRYYRQIAGFMSEPRRHIRGLEVFGGFGGLILHSSLIVTHLVTTAGCVDALEWNHSGGCLVKSPAMPRTDDFYRFDELSDKAKHLSYTNLSEALCKVIQLSPMSG